MYELIFEIEIGYDKFQFNNAEEAVSFAIAAKLHYVDRDYSVSIKIVENYKPGTNNDEFSILYAKGR